VAAAGGWHHLQWNFVYQVSINETSGGDNENSLSFNWYQSALGSTISLAGPSLRPAVCSSSNSNTPTTTNGSGSRRKLPAGDEAGIAVAVVVVVFVVAIALKKKGGDSREATAMQKLRSPLLGDGSNVSGGSSVEMQDMAKSPALQQQEQGQEQGQEQAPPQFDAETGFPLNRAAEKLVAHSWGTAGAGAGAGTDAGADAGADARADAAPTACFHLPYGMLSNCTRGFHLEQEIGGGGSCLVYRAVVFGVPVAVKALKEKGVAQGAQQKSEDGNEKDRTNVMYTAGTCSRLEYFKRVH
jgi:hypothetical protein